MSANNYILIRECKDAQWGVFKWKVSERDADTNFTAEELFADTLTEAFKIARQIEREYGEIEYGIQVISLSDDPVADSQHKPEHWKE